MKKRKIALAIIVLLCGIIGVFTIKNTTNIKNKTKVAKQMSQSKENSDFNIQINQLNSTHTEYAQYIQNCKKTLATAITNKGVETSENDNVNKFVENIGKIFEVQTSDATATAKDIAEGKTAYVSGKQLVGTTPNSTVEEGVDVIPLKEKKYLYNRGDQCTDLTGGWAVRYNTGYESLSYNSDHLSFKSANGNNAGGLSTKKAIDFSGYSRLYVLVGGKSRPGLGVTTNPGYRNDQMNNGYGIIYGPKCKTVSSGLYLLELDIQDINCSGYPDIVCYVDTKSIYEVYIR